jgi:hypothetical protein
MFFGKHACKPTCWLYYHTYKWLMVSVLISTLQAAVSVLSHLGTGELSLDGITDFPHHFSIIFFKLIVRALPGAAEHWHAFSTCKNVPFIGWVQLQFRLVQFFVSILLDSVSYWTRFASTFLVSLDAQLTVIALWRWQILSQNKKIQLVTEVFIVLCNHSISQPSLSSSRLYHSCVTYCTIN